jgi:hypothetical protein
MIRASEKGRNLCLHIKDEALRHEHAFHIFGDIVQESYYTGRQQEFICLTNPELDKDFAFITLTTKKARDIISKKILTSTLRRFK